MLWPGKPLRLDANSKTLKLLRICKLLLGLPLKFCPNCPTLDCLLENDGDGAREYQTQCLVKMYSMELE